MSNRYEEELQIEKAEIKATLMNNIIPFIPRGIKNFVDHGIYHINEVEYKKNELVKWCNINDVDLNIEESFLLDLSVYFHDLGCIIGRKDHAKISAEIIEILKKDLRIDDEKKDFLKLIVSHHAGKPKNKLKKIQNSNYTSKRSYNIRIDLLIAILRLSDVLDAGIRTGHTDRYAMRAPPQIFSLLLHYDKIKKAETKKHWKAHSYCQGISILKEKNKIVIHSDKNLFKKKLVKEIIKNSIDNELSFIKSILCDKYKLPVLNTIIF